MRKQIIESIWIKVFKAEEKQPTFGDRNKLCLFKNSKNNKMVEGKMVEIRRVKQKMSYISADYSKGPELFLSNKI